MKTANMSMVLWSILVDCGYDNYHELHLDWLNNFLTVSRFAEYHNISKSTAEQLIENAKILSW